VLCASLARAQLIFHKFFQLGPYHDANGPVRYRFFQFAFSILLVTAHNELVCSFFYSYFRATEAKAPAHSDQKQSDSHKHPKVVISVPTGAMGDGVAGYLAQRMGLPFEMILATNENDVIARFFHTGIKQIVASNLICDLHGIVFRNLSKACSVEAYGVTCYRHSGSFTQSGIFVATFVLQPDSELLNDAQVPYNLERFLYYLADQDPKLLRSWMADFEQKNFLQVPEAYMIKSRTAIKAVSSDQKATLETMSR